MLRKCFLQFFLAKKFFVEWNSIPPLLFGLIRKKMGSNNLASHSILLIQFI